MNKEESDKVNVRRLMITIEKALTNAVSQKLFEPNKSFTEEEWKIMNMKLSKQLYLIETRERWQ